MAPPPRTSPRGSAGRRSRRRVMAAAGTLVSTVSLVVLGAIAAPVAPAATAATTHRAATAAVGADGVLTGPKGLTLTVTPASLSDVRQGDTVRMHFAGLSSTQSVSTVGTCPAGLDVTTLTTTPILLGTACGVHLPTGISGDTDLAGGGPGISTYHTSLYPRPDGTLDVDFLVGAGKSLGALAYILYKADHTNTRVDSLTCDETHACSIGFIVAGSSGRAIDWADLSSLTMSVKPKGADSSGCTGLGGTSLAASGPERDQDLVSVLNRGFCAATPVPLPVNYAPDGEEEGLASLGSTADVALAGSGQLSKVPSGSVAVPIGLASTVVAEIGGIPQDSSWPGQKAFNPRPVPALAMTPELVARTVLHDYTYDTTIPDPADAATHNTLGPALAALETNGAALDGFDKSLFGLPFNPAPTVTYSVHGDSTAAALGGYLSTQAPGAWTFPANAVNTAAARAGRAVGPITSFDAIRDSGTGTSGSVLTSQTSGVSGLYSAIFSKDVGTGIYVGTCPFTGSTIGAGTWSLVFAKGCLRFGVMDGATAQTLHLQSARLGSGTTFTAATTASLQAAAAGTLSSSGVFTGAAGYPMTFVEYAVVPAAPLLSADCTPRAAEQKLLDTWLRYVVGDGQASLPAGYAPLTDALKAQAVTRIASIGKAAPTGACAPKTPTTKPTPTPVPSSSTGSTPLGGGTTTFPGGTVGGGTGTGSTGGTGGTGLGGGGGDTSGGAPPAASPTAASGPVVASPRTTTVASIRIPGMTIMRNDDTGSAVIAVAVLVALLAAAPLVSTTAAARLTTLRSAALTRLRRLGGTS